MDSNLIINTLQPEYTLQEYHETEVDAPIDTVYDALRTTDFSQSKPLVILFKLAAMPIKTYTLDGFVNDCSFSWLGENPPEEMVLGFVFTNTFTSVESAEDYLAENPDTRIRVIWNFKCTPLSENRTRLSTETRVQCVSAAARKTFPIYWAIIRPFSGWIRRIMLRLIKKEAEEVAFAPSEAQA